MMKILFIIAGIVTPMYVSAFDFADYSQRQKAHSLLKSQAVHVPPGSLKEQLWGNGIQVFKFVTVSNDPNDPDCDFNTSYPNVTNAIQEAIDWPTQYDEIRIVEGVYDEQLSVSDRSITLQGGYASCANALAGNLSSTSSVDTIISPTSPTAGVLAIASTNYKEIYVKNITITNGGNFFGSGIDLYKLIGYIEFHYVDIKENNSSSSYFSGGGMYIGGGEASVYMENVNIYDNTSGEGGGIYCEGANNQILMQNSPMSNNGALNDGGALYLTSGCQLDYYGSGFALNKANRHGGAVYAGSAAKVNLIGHINCPLSCFGRNDENILMIYNIADFNNTNDGFGGAVYATDLNTTVDISNTIIGENYGFNGGGIAVDNQAKLSMKTKYRTYLGLSYGFGRPDCVGSGDCSLLSYNKASTSGGLGGGIFVTGAAEANIAGTKMSDNRADFGVAAAISEASSLTIDSSVVYGNGNLGADSYDDNYVFSVTSDSGLNLSFSTIADNKQKFPVILNYDSAVTVDSSIIHDQRASAPDVYIEAGTSAMSTMNYIIAHEIASLNGSNFLRTDPQFVDRNNYDFHLTGNSAAIDFSGSSTSSLDMDGEDRGWDDPTKGNHTNFYDIGADESYANDIIFKDGFE